jgi:hypothetical protein
VRDSPVEGEEPYLFWGQRSRSPLLYKYNFWQQDRFCTITLVLYIGSLLPQGNHVAKFVKDPIYRTKVIVRKRHCCQKFYL